MANENEVRLVHVIRKLINAENRYKDGRSDARYTDAEMANRKREARDLAISTLRKLYNTPFVLEGEETSNVPPGYQRVDE